MNLKAFFALGILLIFLIFTCSSSTDLVEQQIEKEDDVISPTVFADINFSNWKVTLPVDNDNNGSPDEFQPAQLVNLGYQTIEEVKPFVYDDPSDASIVFYSFPSSSTSNSSYSRTELRELINPANSRSNWTLESGGTMLGRLKVDRISENKQSNAKYHNVIVMQIHGIISQADMAIHKFSSNNGPPLLKMYWKDGFLWAHKKSLVNETTTGDALLNVGASTWTDVKHNFGYVGFEPFDFKITASQGTLELQLNDETPFIYQDVSLAKWPFENYFKAGNYLVTTEPTAFAYIKYYNLTVTH